MTIELREERRLKIQATCDAAKEQAERNRLGQFATPPGLALQITRCAISLLVNGQNISFFDPGIGTGAFFAALLKCVNRKRIKRALGFELDANYGDPARELWSEDGLEVRFEDFTRALPPNNDRQKFNFVISNPPYIRHHHLASSDKQRLRSLAQRACGANINGLAGLYCYFLGLAHPWMAKDAVATWLLPSEFMDVNYGAPVKDYLLSRVTLLRIHRFDPNDVQFGDALVSSAVIYFRNVIPPDDHSVKFSFGKNVETPARSTIISARQLRFEPKWTRLTHSTGHLRKPDRVLGDFFNVRRGLATGANSFFVVSPEQVKEHSLPRKFLVPILPSPRCLPCDEVFADERGHPILDEKLFLIDCSLPEDLTPQFPALHAYLQRGRDLGLSNRYLCASRSPWYAQEKRPPSQLLCTYIGRSDSQARRPFRFILNHSRATAANVYLFLYPKPELASILHARPALMRQIWESLNQIETTTIISEGRVYGGGLHKLEPSELANVPADTVAKLLGSSYTIKPQQLQLCEER